MSQGHLGYEIREENRGISSEQGAHRLEQLVRGLNNWASPLGKSLSLASGPYAMKPSVIAYMDRIKRTLGKWGS